MKHLCLKTAVSAIFTVCIAMLPMSVSAQQFVVHDSKGKIAVIRNGDEQTFSPNETYERNDRFRLEKGASISLLNKITKKIYSADGPGEMTVAEIMTQAMKRAKSHAANVVSAINFTKSNTSATVYEQNGMVRRSQAVLDPESCSFNIEPEALAIAIINAIGAERPTDAPLSIETDDQEGLSFKAKSTDDSPIYFNVIKFRFQDGKLSSADISELGQPINAYVLQPNQELAREQPEECLPGELHLLVATQYGYDVDSLLDVLEELIESGAEIPDSNPELIAYIFPLNRI